MYDRAITNHADGLTNDKPLVYIATCYGSLIAPAYTGKGARVALGSVGCISRSLNKTQVETFFRRMNGQEGQAKRPVSSARAGLISLAAVGAENTTLAPSVLSVQAPCPIKVGDKVTILLDTKCNTTRIPDIEGVGCTVENEVWLNETTLEGTVTAPPPPGAFNFYILLRWINTYSKNNDARLDGNTNPLEINARGPAHDTYVQRFSCPRPSKSFSANVRNANLSVAPKTGFNIVFNGDVRGGFPIAWKSDANDNLGEIWADTNITITYNTDSNETTVSYVNLNTPIAYGEFVHFGYTNEAVLQVVRMHWTPTSDIPAIEDRVPITEVTIFPTDDNSTLIIENAHIPYFDGTVDSVGFFITYRVASHSFALENLNFSDPEIQVLPVYQLDACTLQYGESIQYELNIPGDIQEDEYLIIAVHTYWDLNEHTASYLAVFDIIAEEICSSHLVIDDISIEDGTYQASEAIYNTGAVREGGTVTFEAGDRIRLDIYSKIEAGSEFKATIEECEEDHVLTNLCNEEAGFYLEFADEVATAHTDFLLNFQAIFVENPDLTFYEIAPLAAGADCNEQQVQTATDALHSEQETNGILYSLLGNNAGKLFELMQIIESANSGADVPVALGNLLNEVEVNIMSCEKKAILATMIKTGLSSYEFWYGNTLLELGMVSDPVEIIKADLKRAGVYTTYQRDALLTCGLPGWEDTAKGIGISSAILGGCIWCCDCY